jgi:hypothetical protein
LENNYSQQPYIHRRPLCQPFAKSFPAPKCAKAPFASPTFTLAGFRVKNIQVGELPPEAA